MSHPRFLIPTATLFGIALTLTGCNLFGGGDDREKTEMASASDATDPSITVDATAAPGSGMRVDELLAKANAAEQDGKLADARAMYAEAVEADPGNADAKAGVQRIGAVLAMADAQEAGAAAARSAAPAPAAGSGTAPADITKNAEEMTQVRRAQVRIEAESKVKQGEAALNAGDFDSAIRSFEDALMIVGFNPFLIGGELREDSLQARIDAARRAKSEHERAEEQARQARIQREKQEREDEERARLEHKIVTLCDAANKAFQDDHFSEAEADLEEVLRLDPTNERARSLMQLTRDARQQANDRDLKESYKRNWRETFDELTAELRPQNDLLVFPDDKAWRDIASRGPNEFSVQDNLVSADERAITDKLRGTPMTLTFDNTPLSEAMKFFNTVTGVNFIVSPTIAAAGEEPNFTLNVGPMSALQALDLLMSVSATPIAYRIKDGVVRIVGAKEATGGQVLEFYDIRDLSKKISNFPSKDFNLHPSGAADEGLGEAGPEPQPLVLEGERLAELIKANIAQETWDADPANSIQAVSGALVVRQTPPVHNLIAALLKDLRENAGTLINIESRFLTVSDSMLEDIGVDFRGLGPDEVNPKAKIPTGLALDDFGTPPDGFGTPGAPSGIGTDNDVGVFYDTSEGDVKARVEQLYDLSLGNDEFQNSGGLSVQATFLDDALVEAILRAVSKYGTSNIVDSPSLTVFNGQRASLNVINHFSYVKDFDVEIAQAAVIAQPIVDVIQEGVVLDVRPVVSSDKRFITMELRPTVANLDRPLDTFTTSLAIGSDVTIELPTLRIQRARTTVTMPDGATLLIGGWKIADDQDFESGIPFLNKIPLISFLATRKGKFLNKKKLMVLVHAQIVIPEEGEPHYATAGN